MLNPNEVKVVIEELLSAMEMQDGRKRRDYHIPPQTASFIWNEAKEKALTFLENIHKEGALSDGEYRIAIYAHLGIKKYYPQVCINNKWENMTAYKRMYVWEKPQIGEVFFYSEDEARNFIEEKKKEAPIFSGYIYL